MTRLHHVALGARDVERVASFYRDALGLSEAARQLDAEGALRAIWLDLEGALLMVERSAEAPRPLPRTGAGWFLLALRVTPAERAAIEQRVVAAGAAIESRTRYSSYFRDPEGNRVAISHHPLPPADEREGREPV